MMCDERLKGRNITPYITAITVYYIIKQIILLKYSNYISEPSFNIQTKEDMIKLLNIEFNTNFIPLIEDDFIPLIKVKFTQSIDSEISLFEYCYTVN
jgi:hypothetical protein